MIKLDGKQTPYEKIKRDGTNEETFKFISLLPYILGALTEIAAPTTVVTTESSIFNKSKI